MLSRFVRNFFALTFAALMQAPMQAPMQAQPPAPADGPTELIVTYRCPPPRRAAFRQFMVENGIQRFEHWKQDGLLKDYRFLFSSYVDVDEWDAMAILSFANYAQVTRWKSIEHASPGGLIRDALEMAWPLNTTPADLIFHGESPTPADPASNVYYAVAFDAPTVTAFRAYANAEVSMLNAWLNSGVANYRIYANRYPGGKHWQGLVVLEYRDMEAFAHARELPELTITHREPVLADAIIAH